MPPTGMLRSGDLFALWLVPVEDQARLFTAIIRDLARRFGTTVFPPHVTLCSGNLIALPEEDVIRRMEVLCADLRPVSLAVEGFGLTDDFFSFLFVTLVEIDSASVFERALRIFPEGHGPSVGPHLSLMYGDKGTPIDRARIRDVIQNQLPGCIRFDTLQMVMPRRADWHDIAGWDIQHQVSLVRPG